MVAGALEQIAQAARVNFPARPTDARGQDGVLRCTVCGAVRETLFNGAIVPCACRCDAERAAVRRAEQARREARGELLHSTALSPGSRLSWTSGPRPN